MPALDNTFINSVLDAIMDQSGAAVRLSTGPIKCRLMTANGTAGASGTEVVTGGGYTSGASAPTITFAAASAQSKASNIAVTVANYPRAETVTGIELWDAIPARKAYGALGTSKTMASGDTFSIASGSLTLTLG
jgi:hypothetical protein